MVGIQVGNEQEERKGEEGGFEKIKYFNVSGNAGEDSRGSCGGGRDDGVAFGGDGGRDDGVACGGGGGRDDDVACGGGGGGRDDVRRSSSSMERERKMPYDEGVSGI